MNRRRVSLTILVVCTLASLLLLHRQLGSGAERASVRDRYELLRTALRAGNTNAAALLFLPAVRSRAPDEINRLQTFAHDLGAASAITINGTQAWICPRRELAFIPFLRIGHEIEMIRVEGEWYFSGRISIW